MYSIIERGRTQTRYWAGTSVSSLGALEHHATYYRAVSTLGDASGRKVAIEAEARLSELTVRD